MKERRKIKTAKVGGAGAEEAKRVAKDKLSPVLLNTATIRNRFNDLSRELEILGYSNLVDMKMLEAGMSISIKTDDLFEKDSSKVRQHGPSIIRGFANLAGNVENELRVTSNFSTNNERRSSRLSNKWGLAIQRTEVLGDLLQGEFKIDESRVGFGLQVNGDEQPETIEFLLQEKVGVKEVSLNDLITMNLTE